MKILLIHQGKPLSIWGSLTRCCKAYGLPYHYLKSKTFPIDWKDYRLEKLPFNNKTWN